MAVNPFAAIDKRIISCSRSDGRDEVESSLLTLCDGIGPRFAGTQGYRRAALFMRSRFRDYGLDRAELEPFEFTAWRRGKSARLTMRGPEKVELDCYDLPYSAATDSKGITAELVDAGGGADYEIKACRRKIRGRFVLTDGSGGHRIDMYKRCAALGAAGFILSNRVEGMMLHTGTVTNGEGGVVPAVSIAYESAALIKRLAGTDRILMNLATDSALECAKTWNVAGELRGVDRPDELVIIGGHLDSHDIGPGAYDNASGVVLVMEVARLLASQRRHLKRTVRFLGFAAEEIGLLGSHQYAKAHAAGLAKARFMLNCDTPTLGAVMGLAFHGYPKAGKYVKRLEREMNIPVVYGDRRHTHSDHYPFVLQRVPTAGVGGGGVNPARKRFDHMAADTFDKVPLNELRDTASFIARIIFRAANDERWPADRRDRVSEMF